MATFPSFTCDKMYIKALLVHVDGGNDLLRFRYKFIPKTAPGKSALNTESNRKTLFERKVIFFSLTYDRVFVRF